jgi:hypothetical protein
MQAQVKFIKFTYKAVEEGKFISSIVIIFVKMMMMMMMMMTIPKDKQFDRE